MTTPITPAELASWAEACQKATRGDNSAQERWWLADHLARTALPRLLDEVRRLRDSLPVCGHCNERPAACYGVYENPTGPVTWACDECCGHGNEDGWCWNLKNATDHSEEWHRRWIGAQSRIAALESAENLRRLPFFIAQLRHAYAHLVNGTVGNLKDLADGLLAPVIEFLEQEAKK